MPTDITIEVVHQASKMIDAHLMDYREEIGEAYLNAEKGLTVTTSAKFSPDKDGVKIDVSISFVKESVKNSISVVVDPKQLRLFEGDTKLEKVK